MRLSGCRETFWNPLMTEDLKRLTVFPSCFLIYHLISSYFLPRDFSLDYWGELNYVSYFKQSWRCRFETSKSLDFPSCSCGGFNLNLLHIFLDLRLEGTWWKTRSWDPLAVLRIIRFCKLFCHENCVDFGIINFESSYMSGFSRYSIFYSPVVFDQFINVTFQLNFFANL